MEVKIGKRAQSRLGKGYNPLDPAIQALAIESERDARLFRRAIFGALLAHLILLMVAFPDMVRNEPREVGSPKKVFMVQQIRFQRPPPRAERKAPKPKAKKIPIPDPTPDLPEPIRELEELDFPVDDLVDFDAAFGIPDGPPSTGRGSSGPMEVAGNVTPPEKLIYPRPPYTEEARRARVEGVVIVQTVIDTEGNVQDVSVLKGLPHGLTESAVSTVQNWKFAPATLEGRPVSVYFMLSVTFRIQ